MIFKNPSLKNYFFFNRSSSIFKFLVVLFMEYSPQYEQHIIPEIRNGNEEAYQSVYYHYYESLCNYAMSFIRNREKAEDIVQEVFLKLWIKRASLKTGGSLKPYLYKMTYNEFVNTFRKDN